MTEACSARRIHVGGRVQGVGYRPFVLRLARRLGLRGWVRNLSGAVDIHVEGAPEALARFVHTLVAEAPPLAQPELSRVAATEPLNATEFSILGSAPGAASPIVIPPDHFVCADCLAEIRDPAARRYRYPFINCTQCGPRYTIIDRLPYDRPNTAMAEFALCPECLAEYEDPGDRRYHAQPLACPRCGPELEFRTDGNPPVRGNEAALAACVASLHRGMIVAVKGVGGYHLMCDARSAAAVGRLRARKHRPAKPFAVLVSAGDLAEIARPDAAELALLESPLRPIVLVRKAAAESLADGIAPGLSEVGVMLPYSPLHHLLSDDFGGPLVATSANVSGEPVLTDADSVEHRLGRVAEAFLHHNRPIRRPADDAVFRSVGGKPRPLRPGRGLAPIELRLNSPVGQPTLALGADLKNTIALAVDDRVLVSPHLGDLGAPRSLDVFEQVIEDLSGLFATRPERLVVDAHPGYFSVRWAQGRGLPLHRVFHHHAHASALYGELGCVQPLLVFTWDGMGLGEDGALWGGEALLGQPGHWRRVGSLRHFRLIGGDKASRDPWRCALGMCLEAGLVWPAAPPEAVLARAAWARGLNCPPSSSVGRLFDAAAALTGLAATQHYEGHAAMVLEAQAGTGVEDLPMASRWDGAVWRADWASLLPMLMNARLPATERASRFHASLARLIVAQASQVREVHGIARVGLTGGVFQNRLLTDLAREWLEAAGFTVMLPERLPVNDAAISFGQIVEMAGLTAPPAS